MNEIKFERPKNKNSIIYRAKTVVDRSDDVVIENDPLNLKENRRSISR